MNNDAQTPKPSILIYTMMQDDSFDEPILNHSDIGARLNVLHQALKTLLSSILSKDMARRISLTGGTPCQD